MLRYAVLIVAGCNQVYGLDPTRLPPGAVPVTGQLRHVWAENDASGNPVLEEAGLSTTNDVYLSVRVGDTVVDLDIDDAGGFTFTRGADDEPYTLSLITDGEVVELQHDAPNVRYTVRTAGRFDAARVDDPVPVSFPVTSGTTGAIAATGMWGYTAAGSFAGSYSLDWQKARADSSRHGLVHQARNDVLYNFELAGRTSPEGVTYQTVVSARRNAITMGTTPITLSAPTPVTPAPCSKLVGDFKRDADRLLASAKQFAREYETFSVFALPSLDLALSGSVPIASGSIFGPPANLDITPSLHNPIDGSKLIVVGITTLYRYFRHPDATFGEFLRPAISYLMPLDCAAPSTVVVPATVTIGVPGNMRLQGVALDTDGVDVPMPEDRVGDLELTWDVVSPGPLDYYAVTLNEVRTDGINTTFRPARAFQTPFPKVSISPAGLIRGRYYMIEINALAGFPGARGGDLGTFSYPFAGARTFTSSFRLR